MFWAWLGVTSMPIELLEALEPVHSDVPDASHVSAAVDVQPSFTFVPLATSTGPGRCVPPAPTIQRVAVGATGVPFPLKFTVRFEYIVS